MHEGAPLPDEDQLDYSISFDSVGPSPFFRPPSDTAISDYELLSEDMIGFRDADDELNWDPGIQGVGIATNGCDFPATGDTTKQSTNPPSKPNRRSGCTRCRKWREGFFRRNALSVAQTTARSAY
ncbi:hypothetical protein M569_16998 [Genlisea aurea]|uniref:Uncharacterized protein n=1 Tax=Genlisea aurea TaxID=192259 RepID=S8D532_9LAMI|nr:hypothetical protein M569_16998 [Genlisea aurea]